MFSMVDDLFGLDGRAAIVSGASSGIGRHMAMTLAGAGADVVLVGRDEGRLEEVCDEVMSFDGGALALPADLQDAAEIGRVAKAASVPFGAPDILVNAAGINLREAAGDVTAESWDATLNINLKVPFFLAQELVPGMVGKGYGNIINIASLQTYRAFADSLPYGASKGGVAQLTRAMAEAWSDQGIVANAIAPGFFPTELTKPVYDDPDKLARNAAMTAVGRNGELEDLDGATIFLASRAAAYVTGQVLAVDGGFTAK